MAKTATFNDAFATASTTKWFGYGSNPSVSSGRLAITPTGAYPGVSSATTYDLTASYILVQLTQAPNVGNGTSSAFINAQVSSGNSVAIGVEGPSIVFRETVSGVNSDTTLSYSPVTHMWLRLREASGTIYWDTSADAVNWTTRRSKVFAIPSPTAVTINLFAGFYGAEPSPGTALFDNLNLVVAPASATGWTVGGYSAMGGLDGGTVVARNYFDTADWLWNPIPDNPVLDPDSSAIVSSLASTSGGAQRGANLYDYAAALVGPSGISGATPRYTPTITNYPAWGQNPFGSDTIPYPNGTSIPPGTDGHVAIADPTTGKVYALWQATFSGGVLGASWGAEVDLHGNGLESSSGSSTASGLSRYAAVVRGSEIAAGQIPHALFFATDMAHTSVFRYPASKTDGDNMAGVTVPIPEGARVQLDPSIDVEAIAGITPGEIAVAKALQTYGAYCGDKGGSRMGFAFEYVNDGTNPGQVYVDAGLAWDYFDMTHIPWSSLRVLRSWDGS